MAELYAPGSCPVFAEHVTTGGAGGAGGVVTGEVIAIPQEGLVAVAPRESVTFTAKLN